MTTFRVGEVAILQNCTDPRNNGRECEIIYGLAVRDSRNPLNGEMTTSLGYRVQTSDGISWHCQPYKLRKKQPPRSAKAIMREAILKAKQPQMVPA